MNRDDFSVFFEVLERLEYKAFNEGPTRKPGERRAVVQPLNNVSQIGNARRLRLTANIPGQPNRRKYVRLPTPNGKTIAVSHVNLRNTNGLVIHLDIILAQRGHKSFVLRFDCPHQIGGEHTNFHMQFANTVGPHRETPPAETIDGLAGTYPAVPLPARNSIELLVSAVMALYGIEGMNRKLDGLTFIAAARVAQARAKIIGRSTPLAP